MSVLCPVCTASTTRHFIEVDSKDYYRCERCLATFLLAAQQPDQAIEVAEYEKHNNDPSDTGYLKFLSKVTEPLTNQLSSGAQGLDYGCGPGPALASIMVDKGFSMALYDPFFYPNTAVLAQQYDFVTCTEVVEHFHQPAQEFGKLNQLLKPGAWLAIMTCWQTDDEKFASWHYRRDPTHVVFYKEATLRHIANQYDWQMYSPQKNVALMKKL